MKLETKVKYKILGFNLRIKFISFQLEIENIFSKYIVKKISGQLVSLVQLNEILEK
jgi:hypothetical protein